MRPAALLTHWGGVAPSPSSPSPLLILVGWCGVLRPLPLLPLLPLLILVGWCGAANHQVCERRIREHEPRSVHCWPSRHSDGFFGRVWDVYDVERLSAGRRAGAVVKAALRTRQRVERGGVIGHRPLPLFDLRDSELRDLVPRHTRGPCPTSRLHEWFEVTVITGGMKAIDVRIVR